MVDYRPYVLELSIFPWKKLQPFERPEVVQRKGTDDLLTNQSLEVFQHAHVRIELNALQMSNRQRKPKADGQFGSGS